MVQGDPRGRSPAMGSRANALRAMEEHAVHKAVAERLALAFYRHGAMQPAVREIFPDLTHEQVKAKAVALARAKWFKRLLDSLQGAADLAEDVSDRWLTLKVKNEVMYAKHSADRLKAAQLLMQARGMLVNRTESRSLTVKGTIQDLQSKTRAELVEILEARKKGPVKE